MKRILLFFLSLIVGLALLKWTIDFVGWEEIENTFLVFTGWEGAAIFILTLFMMMVGNWKWQQILKGQGVEFSFWELFKPYLAGFSIMFLAPVLLWAGEIFRGYAIKRKADISWSKTVASVVIDRILEWTSNLVVIFFGLIFFLFKIGLPPKNLLIAFGGVFVFFVVAIFVFYFKTFRRESITKTFTSFFKGQMDAEPLQAEKEIFDFFRFENKSMSKSFALSFLRAGVMYLRTWLLIMFLGKAISPASALSILGFSYLAAMIPIPTSLGSHEAIQAFGFRSLGLNVSAATAFTMIVRASELLFALAGLVIFFRYGLIFFKKLVFEGINKFTNNHEK